MPPHTLRHLLKIGLQLVTAFLALAALGHSSDYGRLTEEFHHTYPFTTNGRVSLANVNGAVHITAWDRNEVKVDAIKRANTKQRLDEAKIRIEPGKDHISIRTEYPDHDLTFDNHSSDNPASVEYTLFVPRSASLDKVELVNGRLVIDGVAGSTDASCVNGSLTAKGLQGRAQLSTVNSRVAAQFDKLNRAPIQLDSVNGSVLLTLPSDSRADIEASTVSGRISNDFGIAVRDQEYVGHDLHARLGAGGTKIRLENVNGRIEVHHSNDSRRISQVSDLNQSEKYASNDDDRNENGLSDNDKDNDNDNDNDNGSADMD
jgi:DUF4097 and DUF4098 domain-containing protein YvlB